MLPVKKHILIKTYSQNGCHFTYNLAYGLHKHEHESSSKKRNLELMSGRFHSIENQGRGRSHSTLTEFWDFFLPLPPHRQLFY